MSSVTHIPTGQLVEGDTILHGTSMVIVERVDQDDFDDDVRWVTVTCVSGNFDQFETPLRAGAGAEWRVLNAEAR